MSPELLERVEQIYAKYEGTSEERRAELQKIADEHGGYVFLKSLDCSRMRARGYDRKAWAYCAANIRWPSKEKP